MNRSVVITVPHSLGREAAIARLRAGVDRIRDRLGQARISLVEENWDEEPFRFGVAALGQTVHGNLSVADDNVRIEVMLPWMLAIFAEKLKLAVQKQGQVLLGPPRA